MSLAPRQIEKPRTDHGVEQVPAVGTAAFGPLYTEHFGGLYDFVFRIVHDRDLAGEVVQSTFTKAWDELRAGHELRHPKTWLYLVARNQAIDEVRRQRRLADEPLVYAQVDPSRLSDPQAVAEDNELVELVWSSAAALNADEYSLLDMHLRRGLDAAELADALELERGAVYTRLSRLRNSLEESVTSTLLVRRGRDDCPELAAIVGEHDTGGSVTPQLRRAVRAHVKECEVCTEARRRMVSPVALFGAFIPIVPLAGMREGILGAILPSGSHAAAGAGVAGGAGAVAAARHGGKAKYAVAGAGGIAAAAAIVSVALSSGGAVVHDPSSARSVDHSVGVVSRDNTVAMRWAPGKNANGYSVVFSRDRSFEPPARANVNGTRYTSPPLGPGRWWFILRSHGREGGWTDTLRVGPFVIAAPAAKVVPPQAVAKANAKSKAKPAVQHRRRTATKTHAHPARKPHTAPAQVVAKAHQTPQANAPPPTHKSPAPTPKKKRKRSKPPPPKKGPPKGTVPPAGVTPTPPAGSAPVVVTTPPPSQPVTQPPVATPPGGEGKDDDDHHGDGDDDHEGEGGGHGDGGHGH